VGVAGTASRGGDQRIIYVLYVEVGVAGTASRGGDLRIIYVLYVEVGVAGTARRGGDLRIRYVLCIAVLLKGQFTHLTYRLKSSKIVHDDRFIVLIFPKYARGTCNLQISMSQFICTIANQIYHDSKHITSKKTELYQCSIGSRF
jgi:hypothetical protein